MAVDTVRIIPANPAFQALPAIKRGSAAKINAAVRNCAEINTIPSAAYAFTL